MMLCWLTYSHCLKNLLIDSLLALTVESRYLNIDMCKFEPSQNNESRVQSADSSKEMQTHIKVLKGLMT